MLAAPGEANDLVVRASRPSTGAPSQALTVTVIDRNESFASVPPYDDLPCVIVDTHTARCDAPDGTTFTQATIRLGDGADRLRFDPHSIPLREQFDMGDGNDDAETGTFVGDASYRWASDLGAGDDRVVIGPSTSPSAERLGLALYAGAGDDTINALNGASDNLHCGAGADTLFGDPFDREQIYSPPQDKCETRPGPTVELPRLS